MAIHELSFQSVKPIAALSFYAHRVDLNQAIVAPDQLPSELGKLAKCLRQENRIPIVADTTEFCLLSPYPLKSNGSFQILSFVAVDITAPKYRRQLEQILNLGTIDHFRNRGFRVDAYEREAFLETLKISEEIETQRFIKWNLRIDTDKYVFFSIDYSNSYHSCYTLDERELSSLTPDQQLVHSYDGKSCRYVGLAGFTVSDIQSGLGNISLLEYHRRKGEISEQFISSIPPATPAIKVNYGSKGEDVIYPHIPHLLKKTFTKDDVEARVFNAQVWSIDKRFKTAIQEIEHFNNFLGIDIPGQKITFNITPYYPDPQRDFPEKHKNNLDFGGGCFGSYPTQGLGKKRLLEKPEQIKIVVFHPENWKVMEWCEEFEKFAAGFRIQFIFIQDEFFEYHSYPIGKTLEIQRKCRNLEKYDLALIFVPDKEECILNPKFDPYSIFKREFVKAMLPSQAIEESTLKAKFKDNTGYNLLLGILGKLGYCPWQLKHMPGDAQAFLGLDIGRKDGVAVGVAAFIVSPQGKVLGWFPANFQSHRETFDITALRSIIFDLINLYEERNQTPLNHLVIHRDGYFQADELDLLDELMPELSQAGIQKLDAVEILKSGYPRAGQWNEKSKKWENPRRGLAWPISETEVALMTTGKTEIKGGTNFVPRPIIVRRRRGETRPGFLAAQVYWLSEMHIGSTQTIRLPITTYYPDMAAEYALEGLLPTGLQKGCKLPF
ncbi:Piwi domain-containing protein [Trichocoleus sp. DQ-U1]|uniref:Piwi domain-containing protein n=1 Tax=Trichocoleus sp. DQ-U1 TaxID=2933926 RepID=UPI00329A7A86